MTQKAQLANGCVIALFVMTTSAMAGETTDGKSCILAAAQRLPNIQGLRITHSETAPPAPDAKIPPDLPPGTKVKMMEVHLTVDAAAQSVTYLALCEIVQGRTVVELVGIGN